jgi:hypothetical protein
MRRIARIVREACFALALVLALAVLALQFAQTTGWLRARVERELRAELGPAAADLSVERVRVHVLRPGLELVGLRIGAERELVYVERALARVSLLGGLRRPRISSVAMHGGRVLLSHELVRRLLGDRAPDAAPPTALELPLIGWSELALAFAAPGGVPVPLGRADLRVASSASGALELAGELRVATAAPGVPSVRVHGQRTPRGDRELQASGQDIELSGAAFAALLAGVIENPPLLAGRLDLNASVRVPADPSAGAQADFGLRLRRGRLEQRQLRAPLEAVQIELDLTGRAPNFDALREAGSWSASAHAAAGLASLRSEAWARLRPAADAREGALLELHAQVPDLELAPRTLEALGAYPPIVQRQWEALSPGGEASLVAGVRVPLRGTVRESPLELLRLEQAEIFAALDHGGRSSLCFRGWPDSSGGLQGVPIPVHSVQGHTLFHMRRDAPRAWRLALHELRGAIDDEGESRNMQCSGWLNAPPKGVQPDIDLEIAVEALSFGPTLRTGLAGMADTAWIWDEFSPAGGLAHTRWRIQQNAALGGLAASGEVDFENASMRWRELPVGIHDLSGELSLRWAHARHPASSDERPVRDMGVHFDCRGKLDTAKAVRVRGSVRGDSRHAPSAELPDPEQDPQLSIAVEIDNMSLKGHDFEELMEYQPELAENVGDFRPRGFASARWHGARPWPDGPYRFDLEVQPERALLTPEFFPRETQDVCGRVLVTDLDPERTSAQADPDFEARLALVGAWAGGVHLAGAGRIDASGAAHVRLLGAGIDPADPALLGAVGGDFAAASGGAGAPATLALAGRLDGEVELELPARGAASAEDEQLVRIFLRGNQLRAGQLVLEDLAGILVHQGGSLSSERIRAQLASTPIELARVRLLPPGTVEEGRERGGILAQPGFLMRPYKYALLAEFGAQELPIDAEHLRPFLSQAALADITERFHLSGAIDLRRMQIAVVGDAEGTSKLGLAGSIGLRDMRLDLGLPLEFSSAQLELRSLVIDQGGARGWAEIEHCDGLIASRELGNARMLVSYVDGRLGIESLDGAFEGGTLSSWGGIKGGNAFSIDLAPPYNFALALQLQEVDVGRFLRGMFDSGIADRGVLDARVRMTGRFDRVLDLSGTGSIELRDTHLWSIPVVRELFSRLGFDASAVFDTMRARFDLHDGSLHLNPMIVRSPLLRLQGKGSLGLDGALKQDLEVRYSLVDRLGPLTRFVYWVNDSLVRVAIRGDMARPSVVLKSSLLGIFDRSPSSARHVPLPGFAPIAPRF